MNIMAVSGGKIEAPAARKWSEVVMRDETKRENREEKRVSERERERQREFCIMRKKGAVRVFALGFTITDGFSVNNRLKKRIFSLITFTNGFSVDNTETENFLAEIVLFKYQQKIHWYMNKKTKN